jgi:hypothetical protein
LPGSFARFKLSAHLLDLRCLLSELRRENFHSFLLLGDGLNKISGRRPLFLM